MGFFSWKTADTHESIANNDAKHANSGRTVYLLQPNGQEAIDSTGYRGDGIFGGVDAYAWLAKNNPECFDAEKRERISELDLYEDEDTLRMMGIDIECDESVTLKFPLKFSFQKDAVYEKLNASEDCEYQGFFYPEDN
jgi:hypothetical protein